MPNPAMRRTIDIVKECRSDIDKILPTAWGTTLEQQAYEKWTVNELLKRLRTNPDVPPLVTMEDFLNQLDEYSTMSHFASYCFSTAKDTVQWIIEKVLS